MDVLGVTIACAVAPFVYEFADGLSLPGVGAP